MWTLLSDFQSRAVIHYIARTSRGSFACYSQVGAYLGTEHPRCCSTSVIVPELMFKRDMAVSLLQVLGPLWKLEETKLPTPSGWKEIEVLEGNNQNIYVHFLHALRLVERLYITTSSETHAHSLVALFPLQKIKMIMHIQSFKET